mgnify:CR=1 FL=1
MKKTKHFLLIISMSIMMVLALSRLGISSNIKATYTEKMTTIDIATAYDIALMEAKEWYAGAKTYLATSTDCDYLDTTQGSDGTRKAWTFTFVKQNPDTCFNVFIKDGAIDHTQEVLSAFNEKLVLPDEKLNISSKEAVKIAREKYGLLPCENWPVGYHLALKNIDEELYLTVIGFDENKEIKRININGNENKHIIQSNVNDSTKMISRSTISNLKVSIQDAMPQTDYLHYVFDQNASAYLSSSPIDQTASGKYYAIGMVAVHPNTFHSNDPIAVASGPVIPFGTVITINQSLSLLKYVVIPGSGIKQWTQFTVEDLGQLQHQQGYSTWWIDIYFGLDNSVNRAAALKFGNNNRVSYTYWAPLSL